MKCHNCKTKTARRGWSVLCSAIIRDVLHNVFWFCTKKCMKAWCNRFRDHEAIEQ